MHPEKHFITIDGHRLAYATAGSPDAPPLLLIHGWISHLGVWHQTVNAFADSHYCVALDLFGLAESDKPADGDYRILSQGRRVLALADALGLSRFTLIGHSMGGQIALGIASVLAPERVTQLVDVAGVATGTLCPYPRNVTMFRLWLALFFPWMWPLQRQLNRVPAIARREFRTWFYDIDSLGFETWALDRKMALSPGMLYSTYRCGQAILACDLSEHLAKISAPTLVIFGRQDEVVPVTEGYTVKALAPEVELVLIDRCGHFPMYEQPARYLDALRSFLC